MTIDDIATIGRYECPVCDDRFHSIAAKKKHVRAEHPR